jgi:AraC-like DNA-binding protein
VVQGAKTNMLGDREITYRGGELVMAGVALPTLAQVTEASVKAPYLAVEIALERKVLGALATHLPFPSHPGSEALTVRPFPEAAVEPTLRLLQLMGDPTDADVLAESVKREILYRVLRSPGGDSLLRLVQVNSVLARIGDVAEWMHDHLETPVRVEDLADRAGMSASSFHRSFREATGTTPVQYHKLLRLHEARRRVATRSGNLTRISAAVGYASPSQFSRDYKRAFGLAPVVDAQRFG